MWQVFFKDPLVNNSCVTEKQRWRVWDHSSLLYKIVPEVRFSPGLGSLQSNYMAVYVLMIQV